MKDILALDSIAAKNKYYKWWLGIITNASSRGSKSKAKKQFGYVEGHHILPISFGATKTGNMSNIVYLTAREHIIIHYLMTKFLEGEYRLKSLRAFHAMCMLQNKKLHKRNFDSKYFEISRRLMSENFSGIKGEMGVPTWFDSGETASIEYFKKTLEEHVKEGMSDPKIAKLYNVSATAIYNWRKKLNIRNRREKLKDKDYLINCYYNLNMSHSQIAVDVGCTTEAVQQYFKKYSIPVRDASSRQRMRADRYIIA